MTPEELERFEESEWLSFLSTCFPVESNTWILLNRGSIASVNQTRTPAGAECTLLPTDGSGML